MDELQIIVEEAGLVIVQPMIPAGWEPLVGPVTTAVSTVEPPKVGEGEAETVTVSLDCPTPKVNELDVAAK